MFLPGKGGGGIDIHGFPMWFTYISGVAASANLVSVVIDHYDRRNNEKDYRKFAKITSQIAGFFFLTSMVVIFLFIATGKKI